MSGEVRKTQVSVIGAGPGGYAAAFMAADLGLDVTLIDVEANPGGTCLYRGCIPSKVLLHVAKIISESRDAKHWGVEYGAPKIDLPRLRESTEAVVEQLTKGLGSLASARKVNYIRGRAHMREAQKLEIFHEDGRIELLETDKTILAAGSRPMLFGPLIDSERIMNSTDALRIDDIPETLLVIGGGYIGLELGTVYAELGSQVTIVEMTDGLLPGADRDLVRPLQKRLQGRIHEILLNTKVQEMKEQKNGIKVTLEGAEIKKPSRVFDKVLVCVGRKPNASGLGLKDLGLELDSRGFIPVDEQMRTQDPNIFAIGDLVGGVLLAHKASAEGRVAAEVIAGHNVAFEPIAIPAVIFTDPEIAWCGLTENEAKEQGRDVNVLRYPWAASGRAVTLNRTEGLTKLLCDPVTGQVLGGAIVGSGAGEMISELVLAVELGVSAKDLDLTIHPHPTLSETIMEAAASFYGTSTHLYRPKK